MEVLTGQTMTAILRRGAGSVKECAERHVEGPACSKIREKIPLITVRHHKSVARVKSVVKRE
jgi:hypothetical protein